MKKRMTRICTVITLFAVVIVGAVGCGVSEDKKDYEISQLREDFAKYESKYGKKTPETTEPETEAITSDGEEGKYELVEIKQPSKPRIDILRVEIKNKPDNYKDYLFAYREGKEGDYDAGTANIIASEDYKKSCTINVKDGLEDLFDEEYEYLVSLDSEHHKLNSEKPFKNSAGKVINDALIIKVRPGEQKKVIVDYKTKTIKLDKSYLSKKGHIQDVKEGTDLISQYGTDSDGELEVNETKTKINNMMDFIKKKYKNILYKDFIDDDMSLTIYPTSPNDENAQVLAEFVLEELREKSVNLDSITKEAKVKYEKRNSDSQAVTVGDNYGRVSSSRGHGDLRVSAEYSELRGCKYRIYYYEDTDYE